MPFCRKRKVINMTLSHCFSIIIILCLSRTTSLVSTASTHDHDQLILDDIESSENVDEAGSDEPLQINDNNFLSNWPIWKANSIGQPNSIILPIIPSKREQSSITDRTRESQMFTGTRNEDENSSVFQDASSAFWNFAGGNDGLFNQLKNQSESAVRGVQSTGSIIGNAVENIIQIGFPHENTSFIEGITNMAEEIEATKKELESWNIKDTIMNTVKETATNLLGQTITPGVTVMPNLLTESDSEMIMSNNNNHNHNVDSLNSRNENEGKVFLMQSSSGSMNMMIIITLLGIIVIFSIILNLVLIYFLYSRRRRRSKTITHNITTSNNKKRSYTLEHSANSFDNIKNQLQIEQSNDLLSNGSQHV